MPGSLLLLNHGFQSGGGGTMASSSIKIKEIERLHGQAVAEAIGCGMDACSTVSGFNNDSVKNKKAQRVRRARQGVEELARAALRFARIPKSSIGVYGSVTGL